ncbi:glycosyltransferase [Burkholderia cepacia]|uniref:glycosyltransferase n=1 Tax=Burkholderia cepacia TaxID=292 RepID=UPI0009BE53E6|nr:glycosyltransferase [Burkholderia cepacia]
MNIVFIHQNIPAQFRHLLFHFGRDPNFNVVAIADHTRLRANLKQPIPGVRFVGYDFTPTPRDRVSRDLWSIDNALRRGRQVAKCLKDLERAGFRPDLVYGHPGWGEMLHVRDVFPDARVVQYCEFYFNREGQDFGFDPEFPDVEPEGLRLRSENMTQLASLVDAHAGISPTEWQRSRYPASIREKISVCHDGVDLEIVRPDPSVRMHLPSRSLTLSSGQQIITYVARNLEPYRGFHKFMRALPEIQRRLPDAHVIIVGGDDVSYGRPASSGSYRARYLAEVGPRLDSSRIHFLGRLSYLDYLRVLRLSTTHVYLTYPFVLSWSMLEAMATGALVIGSATAPVEEVIEDGRNGLLVDFFSTDAIVDAVVRGCTDHVTRAEMCRTGIETVRERFSLRDQCLPGVVRLLTASR